MITSNGINLLHIAKREEYLLKKHYDFLHSFNVLPGYLECKGSFQPSPFHAKYEYKICYNVGQRPLVFITSPLIIYEDNNHTHFDNSLCLYWQKEFKWTHHKHIYQFTIPWIAGWIISYEIFQAWGYWPYPNLKHSNTLRSYERH